MKEKQWHDATAPLAHGVRRRQLAQKAETVANLSPRNARLFFLCAVTSRPDACPDTNLRSAARDARDVARLRSYAQTLGFELESWSAPEAVEEEG